MAGKYEKMHEMINAHYQNSNLENRIVLLIIWSMNIDIYLYLNIQHFSSQKYTSQNIFAVTKLVTLESCL